MPYERIDVSCHLESVVHSLVEFVDGSSVAQLGLPDMSLPIQYALAYPEADSSISRSAGPGEDCVSSTSSSPKRRFPALRLAREVGMAGRTYPTILSAADDEAVAAFLAGELRFSDIPTVVEIVVEKHQPTNVTLESIWDADRWARAATRETICTMTA